MTLDWAGCLGCILMHKLFLDAPRDLYGCSRWPSMQLDVLVVYQFTSCVLMHKKIDLDDQGDPWCIWMSIDVQVVSRSTKGFIWMLKMTLDEAGCLRCLEMHNLWLDAPRDLYGCSRWPLMQLDVLDVYRCTSCALMHQHIFIDFKDNPWYVWMCLDVLDCS